MQFVQVFDIICNYRYTVREIIAIFMKTMSKLQKNADFMTKEKYFCTRHRKRKKKNILQT